MNSTTIEEIMHKVSFPDDAVQELLLAERCFTDRGLTETLNKTACELADLTDEKALGAALKEFTEHWEKELGIHRYTLECLILLECWKIARIRYTEKGISEEIFWRSCHDMTCKLMECRNVYGVNGIFVGHWYDRFFQATRFALGRLQFEQIPYPLDEPYQIGEAVIRKGDIVINMHIPSEGPLTEEAVADAFEQAHAFFPSEKVYVMDSWLLDPELMEILPEGNIKKFTSRFDVIHSVKFDTFQDGWRVFGPEWKKEPELLPMNTALQKPIATYLKKGGLLGEGFGILIK